MTSKAKTVAHAVSAILLLLLGAGGSVFLRDPLLMRACMLALTGVGIVTLAIDELADQRPQIDSSPSATRDGPDVLESSQKLLTIMVRVSSLFKAQKQHGDRFAENLAAANSSLSSTDEPARVRALIRRLIEENAQLSSKLVAIATKLEYSRTEAEELRSTLSQAKKEAFRDCVTGLANRRSFNATLESEIAAAHSSGANLCLGLADIDDFKKINDTHGHLIGDIVLQQFAELLAKSADDEAYVSRFGGEEFAIILPDFQLREAVELLDNVRRQLEAKQWTITASGQKIKGLTASFGVASLRQADNIDTIVGRVDERLYEAKAKGKNRVIAEIENDASGSREKLAKTV